VRAVFHRPHSSPQNKGGAVRSVRELLDAAGANLPGSKTMLEYKGYVGTVEPDEGAFIGRVVGLRDVITFEGETYLEVEQAFRDSIDDYLAFPAGTCATSTSSSCSASTE
jgi:hypothetical protein